jgi:hypothetical protein
LFFYKIREQEDGKAPLWGRVVTSGKGEVAEKGVGG